MSKIVQIFSGNHLAYARLPAQRINVIHPVLFFKREYKKHIGHTLHVGANDKPTADNCTFNKLYINRDHKNET